MNTESSRCAPKFGYLGVRIFHMRQISIHRPYAKVRGIKRRLKSLDTWAHHFKHVTPYHDGERYCNYRLPVLDRLVNPPTTTKKIQSIVLSRLLVAACHLEKSPLKDQLPYYKVAVLVILPFIFHSEVTVFYSKEYYQTFHYSVNVLPQEERPSSIYNFDLPSTFMETGCLVEWEDELEEGVVTKFSEKRWTLGPLP